jgi:hypothetical protein
MNINALLLLLPLMAGALFFGYYLNRGVQKRILRKLKPHGFTRILVNVANGPKMGEVFQKVYWQFKYEKTHFDFSAPTDSLW